MENRSPPRSIASPQIAFSREELSQILRVYGFFVANGDWRDYAIDSLKEMAVFSIYRRTAEAPLYRITKNPKLTKKQGAYTVFSSSGYQLRRGHDLTQVLRIFDRQKLKLTP